ADRGPGARGRGRALLLPRVNLDGISDHRAEARARDTLPARSHRPAARLESRGGPCARCATSLARTLRAEASARPTRRVPRAARDLGPRGGGKGRPRPLAFAPHSHLARSPAPTREPPTEARG